MRFFDLHCDTLTHCRDTGTSLFDGPQEVNLRNRPNFEEWCQCFAVFIGDNIEEAQAFEKYTEYIEFFINQMTYYRDYVAQCRDFADIDATLSQGKCAAIITVENAAALSANLNNIERFAGDDVKAVSLTWNGENALGYGCGIGGHLKPLGREAVLELARNGIVIDVSHLSDEGFYDVLEITDGQVVATHSNLRGLCTHSRNLTENQLRAISERGGIVGLNLHKPFLSESEQSANNPETLLRHADRMLNIAGEDTVCFGSDFDGAQMPEYCRDISHIPALYNMFVGEFGAKIAEKIFFDNAKKFFCSVM